MKDDLRLRLTQSVETAVALAEGLVAVDLVESGESRTYSERFACPEHGVSLPELQPRIFSFNSPHGACPRCTGLGAQQEIDPDLLVPDPSLSIDEGALVPWAVGELELLRVGDPGDRRPLRDPDRRAVAGARPSEQQGYFLVRHRRRQGLRHRTATGWAAGAPTRSPSRGSSPRSSAATATPTARTQRERIEEYMSFRPCPVCKGARLKPEVLAVTVGERNIHEFTQLSVAAALRVPRRRSS